MRKRQAVAILILAPIAAAVLITLLLLLGVPAHLVFLPGHGVKAALAALGLQVHNRVGVISTEVFWWAVIVAIGFAVRRR